MLGWAASLLFLVGSVHATYSGSTTPASVPAANTTMTSTSYASAQNLKEFHEQENETASLSDSTTSIEKLYDEESANASLDDTDGNTSRNATSLMRQSTTVTDVASDFHLAENESNSIEGRNHSKGVGGNNISTANASNGGTNDTTSGTGNTTGNNTRNLTYLKQGNTTNSTNDGSGTTVAKNQSSLNHSHLTINHNTSNRSNSSMKLSNVTTSSDPSAFSTRVTHVGDNATATTSTTSMTATSLSTTSHGLDWPRLIGEGGSGVTLFNITDSKKATNTWGLAHVCRDLDDFEPGNILSEWCVVSAVANATACANMGCEVRFGAGPDKYQCVCHGRVRCGRFDGQMMQTTCGDKAAQAEIPAELLAVVESGTCDGRTGDTDVEEWVRSRAARCCKSFPASACEKDAEVAHPCIDATDFMPDKVMSGWCEFHHRQPIGTECVDAGCKLYDGFCHCDSVAQCNHFGGVFKEATCLAQGTHWSDYRKMLSSVSAAGTCANQTTPWGADLGNFLQEQAESCCRSFPFSVCQKQAGESTTTAVANKFLTVQSPEAVAALLQEQETEALDYLLSESNATFSQVKLPGSNSVVVAQRLSTKALARGNIQVAIASNSGQTAGVSVPAAILDSLPGSEDGVLVVSSLDVGLGLPINASGSDGVANQVRAALSINLASASSRKYVHVEGLLEPIILTFPVNASPGIVCAYWDEEESRWSQRGMQQVGGNASSLLTCSTTHLTLFAAIAGEVKKTIMCAQTMALSKQSLAALGVGNWFLRWDACMLWLLILLHVGLITAAFCLDDLFYWSDDQFLCCTGHHAHEAIFDRCAAPSGGMWSGCAALRTEWLVELCGFTSHFLVNSCATICQFVAPEDSEQRTSVMRSFLSRVLATSLQNQTSATLQMDIEDVQFVTMCRRKLLKHTEHQETWDALYAPQHAWEVPTDKKLIHQFDCLVQKVGQHLDQHVWAISRDDSGTWKVAFALLRSQSPWLAVFRFSIFMPASMRGLLLSCRLFGAMLVISLFFQTSGQALVVSSDQNCEEDPKGIVELLAQCLVIGLGSLIIARIPVCILARLHSRQFRFYESENVPDRERQLRVWRHRDVVIWIFGVSYLAICILFLMTFLANIDAGDATEWKIAVSLELLSEFILVPTVAALFLLVATKLTSKWTGALREGAERVGSTVAGEVDRPLAPTAAKVRLKTAMDKFRPSGPSVQHSGKLEGSSLAAKLYLKALFDAFRVSIPSEDVHSRCVLPVWPPLPPQLPPELPPVPQERSNRECIFSELRCTSFCETTCNVSELRCTSFCNEV